MNLENTQKLTTKQFEDLRWLNVDFGGFVKPKTSLKAISNVFTTKTNISITNTGQTPLNFCFARKHRKKFEESMILLPGEVKVINAKDFQHIIWDFIIVKNEHPDKEGAYFIYISDKN